MIAAGASLTVAPVFATSFGLAALVVGEHDAEAAAWRHLRVPGVDRLLVMGARDGHRAEAAGCVAMAADLDAATVNLAASSTRAAP